MELFDNVDKDNIGIEGISWGGVITSLTIGFDLRYKFAVSVYGSGFLKENLGGCGKFFNDYKGDFWFAEKNFDKVKIPVLWLCWDDDCAFSLNSVSASYQSVVKNNKKTQIAIVEGMGHSMSCGWLREEPYVFADYICKGKNKAPEIINYKLENNVELFLNNVKNCKAFLYFKKSELKHEKQVKYGEEKMWPAEEFQKVEVEIKNSKLKFPIPDDVKCFYLAVKKQIGEKEVVISTPLITK